MMVQGCDVDADLRGDVSRAQPLESARSDHGECRLYD
jgi:hypothetical protein